MTFHWTLYFCLFLGLWSALVAGVFKAFSEFIMSGLLRAKPEAGIESMQQINITVLRTEFVSALVSISVFSTAFAVYALFTTQGASAAVIVLAAVVYVPSVFLVTILGNVPLNKKLGKIDPESPQAVDFWNEYGVKWTRLNHLRTLGSIFTAGLYLVAAVSLIASNQA